MTVYVTGDIHSGLDMQKLRDWELGDSLGSDDHLIIAGDFGFPWDFSAEECADIAWLESRPYTVLFVDGNHERFDHWEERPMEPWHGGLTQRLSDTSSIRRLMRGRSSISTARRYSPWAVPQAWTGNTACRIPAGGLRSSRTSAISIPRGQGSTRSAGRSTASSPIPAPRACSPTLYPDPGWERPDVDRLTGFLDELEDRLDYKRWYCGHFHRDGNPDERHTVLYDRIVRLGDKLLPWGAY